MPDAYSTAVLADSPILYYRVNEPSGTSVTDSAGSHTGTYTAGVTLAQPGALITSADTAIRLTTGSITIPDASDIRLNGSAFTAEAWIDPDNSLTSTQMIFGFYDAVGPNQGWAFGLSIITPGMLSVWAGPGASWITSTTAFPTDGLWHHAVLTVSAAGAVTFYQDGVSVSTGVGQAPVSTWTGGKRIGQHAAGGNQFVGGIDEAAIYPTELSAVRVAAHYAAGATVTVEAFAARVPLVGGLSFAPGLRGPGTDRWGDMR